MPESSSRFSVAIAGCGATSAVGRGVDSLRSALRANASGLRAVARFDKPSFQSCMAGACELESGSDDPAWQLADCAVREAREQARETLAAIPAKRVGLVLSTTKANIEAMERLAENRPCSDAARRHLRGDALAVDLAVAHGFGGPVQCVSVACASGLVAIAQGSKLIQRGAADAVVVIGVDHLSAFVVAGFSALKALDPGGCRPFDKERRGLSPGEAGAAIVLARADHLAVPGITVAGWGGSNDANHMTGPARDGSGLARAIRGALDAAGIEPEEIDYINAHGTGTPYNDAMETAALHGVFGENPPPVSGAKGMLGHTLGAAGVVESILCVLAMQERLLPGTARLNEPAHDAPASVIKAPRPLERLDWVLKLNSGFGGVNSAVILRHG